MRRAIEIQMEIAGSGTKLHWISDESYFLKVLEDFEYFKSEGLAKEVVKEVFALKDGEKFKVLKYTFTKKEIMYDYDN